MQASKMPAELMEVVERRFRSRVLWRASRDAFQMPRNAGRAEIALYRIAKVLENCRREFGHDTQVVPRTGQFDKRTDNFEALASRGGITLFKRDCRERRRDHSANDQQLKQGKVRFVTDMGACRWSWSWTKKRLRRRRNARVHWEYRVIKHSAAV